MEWKKSSYSLDHNACVEVAEADGQVKVRDSKNPDNGQIHLPAAAWQQFVAGVKAGEFD